MVQYNPKVWFSVIFHSYSRQVMHTLRPALIFLLIFSSVVCLLFLEVLQWTEKDFHSTIAMHQLLGIVLGLFLVFRVNSAYDRWWEGRKLWGSLVNNTRNLSFKINAFLPEEDRENREWFANMISNIPASLRDYLRGRKKIEVLDLTPELIARAEKTRHVPNLLSSALYEKVQQLTQIGKITSDQFWLLDRELKEFSDIIGACERIKNTPIPYSYAMYIKKFIFIYLITLPFGLVITEEYMTIPMVLLLAFVLLSVELIAEEIEDPFGTDINDLPTDELSGKMRDWVREIILR
ncbi:MAG: bestrophin family protein [Cyclobacteriaceae bacterium]